VSDSPHSSTSALHKQWVKLEDEHHELAIAIDGAQIAGADLAPMRERQAKLLLEISAIVAEIRDAPATTIEDFAALLDVALEHEIELAADIAFYGLSDYPMIARLLRALACRIPGFEFNSLRRWLSLSGTARLQRGRVRAS
jgi:sulfite reductase beta subunit-like hemoprotein